jgi:hypothetical protein
MEETNQERGTLGLTAPRAPVGTPTLAISGNLIGENGCYSTDATRLFKRILQVLTKWGDQERVAPSPVCLCPPAREQETLSPVIRERADAG